LTQDLKINFNKKLNETELKLNEEKKISEKQLEEKNKFVENEIEKIKNENQILKYENIAEREINKMRAQQNRHQMVVDRMKNDLEKEKRKTLEIQLANAQKDATYEKTQRQRLNIIHNLERESALKSVSLKIKAEEVQRLKEMLKCKKNFLFRKKKFILKRKLL
jgi:hypothetical protein